jgi:hypothetical protein
MSEEKKNQSLNKVRQLLLAAEDVEDVEDVDLNAGFPYLIKGFNAAFFEAANSLPGPKS